MNQTSRITITAAACATATLALIVKAPGGSEWYKWYGKYVSTGDKHHKNLDIPENYKTRLVLTKYHHEGAETGTYASGRT